MPRPQITFTHWLSNITITLMLVTLVTAALPYMVFAASVSTALLDVPAEPFIGKPILSTISVDNSRLSTGYSAYINLFLPKEVPMAAPAAVPSFL
ncbi:MAG: hypothetical protein GFH27_549305n175 [Chloroflexi bacterium AL-W]|nr:hypothetical protein [Chloroflexi bacterium AL-N1]NOK69421.1 hypothetical protein [Chloroflexi bacterium AL-N10]NOK76482.1 hypothetical protein [Chloroflexi bacterium AL-N5]NOK83599.1 hypothetical protein [Chloroflexi bacterium AL-W]NOK91260.1 hypothetical protein [Chloroflexi bacterium AL-N15]